MTTTKGRLASCRQTWSPYARHGRSGVRKTTAAGSRCLPISRSEWKLSLRHRRTSAASPGRPAMLLLSLWLTLPRRAASPRPAIYRTIRDRLSTAGGLNSVTRPVPGKPLSVEVVFSCMHIGRPSACAEEWQPLGAKFMLVEDVWIHEAEPATLRGERPGRVSEWRERASSSVLATIGSTSFETASARSAGFRKGCSTRSSFTYIEHGPA